MTRGDWQLDSSNVPDVLQDSVRLKARGSVMLSKVVRLSPKTGVEEGHVSVLFSYHCHDFV